MSLAYVSQQITIFVGWFFVITGVIGNSLNILIFTSIPNYRTTPCTFSFLFVSIVNILIIIISLISRIFIAGYYIDLTRTTPFWCKFRAYLTAVTTLMSFTYTCLASIDQVFVTSRSATLRRFSNIKFTRRIMLIFVIIWCLYCIPHVFFYDISPTTQTCTIINTSYGIYAPVYVLSLTCTIPIGIMIVCGYLTYRNIRLTRILVNQLADYQLVRMTLIQIVLIVFTIGPYGVNNVYNLLTSSIGKDSNRLLKESFASSMFSLIVYANYVGNFYMFLLSSRRFRRQVKNRLLFWLRQGQIHPVMTTRI
ncbi:unnamed protein product [Adineta ricciae]|uniref:G-protein coupled receptors family 1 profile domain-containing protein n=1 Tax=Adineta ricciae TaxID=249248 RepID=A0A815IZ45_ADIRI|nr:unnamed protein product [Adineta ricciae]CAF1553832.1 unnamed protein product [Adineta ricciae]